MAVNIYENGQYDAKPPWLEWSLNGVAFCDPISLLEQGVRIESFCYRPLASARIRPSAAVDLNAELSRTAQTAVAAADGATLAVLVSGRDSELVARILKKHGGAVEIWHARYSFRRDGDMEDMKDLERLARDLDVQLHVVDISHQDFIECNYDFTRTTGIAEPALGGLSALILQIPEDHFVFMGDGDIAKDPRRYDSFYNPGRYLEHGRLVREFGQKEMILPFIPDEVMYRIWSQKKQRRGDFCFFQSDLGMIAAFARHRDLVYDCSTGSISLEKVYAKNFPELIFRQKTDPFPHPEKGDFKNRLRHDLYSRYGSAYNEAGVGCCWMSDDYLIVDS